MNCTLKRLHKLSTGIFSYLYIDLTATPLAVAEHAYKTANDTYEPKILPGIYKCIRRHSPEFGYDLFWITDVPGCEWIEMHIGNFPQIDSKGCSLLGITMDIQAPTPMVTHSKEAFEKFMWLQKDTNEFTLTVI